MGRHSRGLWREFCHIFFGRSFFLGSCKCTDAKDAAAGKLGSAGGAYASSKHPEIIHVLIGMIFSKEIRNNFWSAVPWYICYLGQSKRHGTLHTGSPCAIAFSPSRDWTSTRSLPVRTMVCLWVDSEQINFPTSTASCSMLRKEKELFFFWKIRHVPQQAPKQSSTAAHLFPWV